MFFKQFILYLNKRGNHKAIQINVHRPQPRPVRHQKLTESHSVPMLRNSELLQLILRDFRARDLTNSIRLLPSVHMRSLVKISHLRRWLPRILCFYSPLFRFRRLQRRAYSKHRNRKLIKAIAD